MWVGLHTRAVAKSRSSMSWSTGPSHMSDGTVPSSSAAEASAEGSSAATAFRHRADSPRDTDCRACSECGVGAIERTQQRGCRCTAAVRAAVQAVGGTAGGSVYGLGERREVVRKLPAEQHLVPVARVHSQRLPPQHEIADAIDVNHTTHTTTSAHHFQWAALKLSGTRRDIRGVAKGQD